MELSPEFVCNRLGFQALNNLQETTLAAASLHNELVLLAPTGSGKTVAFLLPVLRVLNPEKSGIQALIIAPSRELVLQTEQVFRQLATGCKVLAVYGGHSLKSEQASLQHPPAVLIATPGRLRDLLQRGMIDLTTVQSLVFDEFDKALELGFQPDLEVILQQLTPVRQRILVSATDMEQLPAFTGITAPHYVEATAHLNRRLTYHRVLAEETEKAATLLALLREVPAVPTIVFCNHRESVVRIGALLQDTGLDGVLFHGGMEQDERERALFRFRNGSAFYLISTDLAGRGIDIPEVEHIIHYQLPTTEATLIHRNGRTARRSGQGTVFFLLTTTDRLPAYIPPGIPEFTLTGRELPPIRPTWTTIYIGGGRKEKINKTDVLGFLVKTGGLNAGDIGLIQVADHACLVAVKARLAHGLLQRAHKEKIKGKRVKIAFAR